MAMQLVTLSGTMLGLGVLGTYMWNSLEQSRKRPLFIVDHRSGGHQILSLQPGLDDSIPFYDQKAVSSSVQASLHETACRVLDSSRLILGPELIRFEQTMPAILGVGSVVGVANGTDAITLALWAAGLGSGELVAVPAISAPATAVAVLRAGCRPFFVDVLPQSLTMDPEALTRAASQGARAAIPVHLYGNPCHMDAILDASERYELILIEDCAQAAGSTYLGKPCGSFGHFAAFSFYPTKNLGGYGDGGAIATSDPASVERLKRLRFYGQNEAGECVDIGLNSRLDELQAALLLERLKVFDVHCSQRLAIAAQYDAELGFLSPVPTQRGRIPHLYVIRHKERDDLSGYLDQSDVATQIHYPYPLHKHRYLAAMSSTLECPVAEAACTKVLSLPCYPNLSPTHVDRVIKHCRHWARANRI